MTSISTNELFTAFEYAFPVFEMAKMRWKALHDASDPTHTGLNTFWHQERLATAEDRWVTTPNIDTLYSIAWVDLSQGPVRVTIPATEGRYLNLAFLDIYSNNFECLSQRDVGSAGHEAILVGPTWIGEVPRDQSVIRAPFDDVMLFARTLVDSESDMPAARSVQHGIRVEPLQPVEEERPLARGASAGEDFVQVVRHAFRRNPPPAYESQFRTLLSAAGLLDNGDSAIDASMWSELLPVFLSRVTESTRKINVPVDGWVYAPLNMGNFGTSYRLRAAVARGGLLALPRSEAFYISTEFDSDERELHGDNVYSFELPVDGIPADAFWSLTLYEKMPNGARFLARNPLDRHAFTDRTVALHPRGGKQKVWISHRRPPEDLVPNWLPAPAAPFRLSLRAYHPRPELLAGTFRLNAVAKAEDYNQNEGASNANA